MAWLLDVEVAIVLVVAAVVELSLLLTLTMIDVVETLVGDVDAVCCCVVEVTRCAISS
jgi:hypothetical protein